MILSREDPTGSRKKITVFTDKEFSSLDIQAKENGDIHIFVTKERENEEWKKGMDIRLPLFLCINFHRGSLGFVYLYLCHGSDDDSFSYDGKAKTGAGITGISK